MSKNILDKILWNLRYFHKYIWHNLLNENQIHVYVDDLNFHEFVPE